MKHFFSLLKHELRTLFFAPASYTAGFIFLMLMGFIYLLILEEFSLKAQDVLPAEMFFQLFWIPVFFMVPLITMKSFAEERRMGTLETLMTTPVTAFEVVMSKFLASYLLYCLLWALTMGFPLLVSFTLDSPTIMAPLLDLPTFSGSYLFVFTSGLLFIAIGILSSSLTRSQLVAGMLCFFILFFLILGSPALISQSAAWLPWLKPSLDYFHIFEQLEDFSRGIIDTRPLFYYLSLTALVLGVSTLVVESKA